MRPSSLLPCLASTATAFFFSSNSTLPLPHLFARKPARRDDPNSGGRLYGWLTPGGERMKADITSPHSTCKLRDDSVPGDKVVYCVMGYPFGMLGADKISVALYGGEDCKGFADHCSPRDEFCPSTNVQDSEGRGRMVAHHFVERGCFDFPEGDVAGGIDKIAFHIMDWAQRPRHKPSAKMESCKLTVFGERECKGYALLKMKNDDELKCLTIPNYITAPRSLRVQCKPFE